MLVQQLCKKIFSARLNRLRAAFTALTSVRVKMYSYGAAAHRGEINHDSNETVYIQELLHSVLLCRSVYSAAVWYYHHLAGLINVVMITEDQDAVAQYCNLTAGVYVITVRVRTRTHAHQFLRLRSCFAEHQVLRLQDFLQNFWPELRAVQELYASVCQALQEKAGEGSQREYAEHLHAKVLEAGIKSGRYVQVQEQLGCLTRTNPVCERRDNGTIPDP